jgi:hypothetical protein
MVSSMGNAVVPPVDLVEVDVVHVESAQRRVDPVEDVAAGQAGVVGTAAHRATDLRRQHVVLASAEVLLQQASGQFLAHTLRVHVGGVVEGDARLHGGAHERLGVTLLEHPVTPA